MTEEIERLKCNINQILKQIIQLKTDTNKYDWMKDCGYGLCEFRIRFGIGNSISISGGQIINNDQFFLIRKSVGGCSGSSHESKVDHYMCDKKKLIKCIESKKFKKLARKK